MKLFKILMIMCLLLTLLLQACSHSSQNERVEKSEDSFVQSDNTSGNSEENVGDLGYVDNKSPSLYHKIIGALDQGEINLLEASKLHVTAAFMNEDLPDAYRTVEAVSQLKSDYLQYYLQYLFNHRSELSGEDLKKYEPYMLEPNTEKSFFHPEYNTNRQSSKALSMFSDNVYAAGGAYHSLAVNTPGSDGLITIYYADIEGLEWRAKQVKKAMEDAWPKFKSLMGMQPLKPIPVYIVNLHSATSKVGGEACYEKDSNNIIIRTWINIDFSLSDAYTKATAVHELFHIFQYYAMTEYNNDGAWWLQEATAVWSQNYVYPDNNMEYNHLPSIYNYLEEQLVVHKDDREYGGYLFFFFLSEYFKDNTLIPKIIKGSKGINVESYMMGAIPDYSKVFARFATWNWNQIPWKEYSDNGKFPAVKPNPPAVETISLKNKEAVTIGNELAKGGTWYLEFNVDNDKIERVNFDFSKYTWDESVRINAAYNVNGVWQIEDWTGLPSVYFCHKKADKKISKVLLCITNTSLTRASKYALDLDTKGACEAELTGYTKITESVRTTGTSWSVSCFSKDTLVYNKDEDYYVLKSRNITFNRSTSLVIGDAIFGETNMSESSSGNLSENYTDISEAPFKISLDEDGGGVMSVDPATIKTDWVTINKTLNGQSVTEKGIPSGLWVDYYELEIKPDEVDDNKIRGQRSYDVSNEYGNGTINIEFEYDLN